MARNLLQSHAWEKYAESDGDKVFWRDGDGYSALTILKKTPLGNYLFCPYGPEITGKDAVKSLEYAVDSLRGLAREHEAFFLRVEPTRYFSLEQMKERGFVKSHDLEPADTLIVDLERPEEEILAGIAKRKVQIWKARERKGVTVRTSKDPEDAAILASLLKGVAARNNFIPQDGEHLKKQMEAGFATLYVAEYEGKPIAAVLVYDYDGVRYYAHVAADDEYRKLEGGTILVVQMIVDAKREGAKKFDFWGITTSEDPKHPWYGFTQFKKSFGGEVVNYTGTWDLPLRKARYKAYQVMRKVNRAARKR